MGGGPDLPLRPRKEEPVKDESEGHKHLRAIVDMGSNGIRFSISDLSPPTTRILPTLHMYRVSISLYDEQFDNETGERIPLSTETINSVVAALLRFRIICTDLGVAEKHIRVIATEATRTAINSEFFCNEIKKVTGLTVELLPKQIEGKIGALGIASSFSDMRGLVMDLGGGSTQITWMIVENGIVRTSTKGSFSFPYGAAALTMKLAELKKGKSKQEAKQATAEFRQKMKNDFLDAYKNLEIPEELIDTARSGGGFRLYLSGGGFRGWGYLLLYLSQVRGQHYPISKINGFTAQKSQFENTEGLKQIARDAKEIFRVSDRRRKQVPAVAFLINVLAEALPHGIREAHFCQGGVREGVLYQELSQNIRSLDPLEVATQPFARPSADVIGDQLIAAIPSSPNPKSFPESISMHSIHAFANMMYTHANMSKESSSTVALYSTSTGILAAMHGVSHTDRALLALMLEERYEGRLPPREAEFKDSLANLLQPEEVWWAMYIGRVALVLAKLYPSGVISRVKRVELRAEWAHDLGKKKSKSGIRLVFEIQKRKNDPLELKETLAEHVKEIEKAGKKKNWIGGSKGWGVKVEVGIVELDDFDD